MTILAARILTNYYCERLAAKLPLNLEKVPKQFVPRTTNTSQPPQIPKPRAP